ncbi:MAG: hypothetical protein UW04_C0009G0004 [Parcubacteria group bacterium GW2011_GWB1_43_8]|nr:MAG: hypothetical protein UW04_C0009G0004 [Parcubacteria group bacterium GW2011_GWB1_43_8]
MKKTIIIVIILIIAGAIFWMFKSKTNTPATETTNMPTTQNQVDDTEITTINSDIESIDVGDIDQEFNDLNKDLQGL